MKTLKSGNLALQSLANMTKHTVGHDLLANPRAKNRDLAKSAEQALDSVIGRAKYLVRVFTKIYNARTKDEMGALESDRIHGKKSLGRAAAMVVFTIQNYIKQRSGNRNELNKALYMQAQAISGAAMILGEIAEQEAREFWFN